MKQDILILNQIENTIQLYIDCFKRGYTTLHYFYNPAQETIVELTEPKITIKELESERYYFYCTNENEESAGDINVEISGLTINEALNNVANCSGLNDDIYKDIIDTIEDENFVLDVFNKMTDDNKEEYEKLLLALTSFYNMRQEELNLFVNPIFNFDLSKIESPNNIKYNFMVYEYNKNENSWSLLREKCIFDSFYIDFHGKPSTMYLIAPTIDSNIVREYFIYQPSKTLSEAKYERRILDNQNKYEKTIKLSTQMDLSELIDDEEGQEIVSALQFINPKQYVFNIPVVNFKQNKFEVKISDFDFIEKFNKNIYLGALEIDQAFSKEIVPHKIKISSSSFKFSPANYLMNSGENYIFFITDNSNKVLSECSLGGYNTGNDLLSYYKVSRKIDVETYRRQLFNIFMDYNKKDWPVISSIIDTFILSSEDYTESLSEFTISKILNLDPIYYRIDFLIQLMLLYKLKYTLPVNQDFLKQQVFANSYHKHVFPEGSSYIVQTTKINDKEITIENSVCGSVAKEVKINKDDFIYFCCYNMQSWECSSIAFYNNKIREGQKYFFFPKLEVEII